jgi:hypothetical protein
MWLREATYNTVRTLTGVLMLIVIVSGGELSGMMAHASLCLVGLWLTWVRRIRAVPQTPRPTPATATVLPPDP